MILVAVRTCIEDLAPVGWPLLPPGGQGEVAVSEGEGGDDDRDTAWQHRDCHAVSRSVTCHVMLPELKVG